MLPEQNPGPRLVAEGGQFQLHITLDKAMREVETSPVTTDLLGKAKIPALPYVNPDGSPIKIDRDYFGNLRNASRPIPGPFEPQQEGALVLKVW